MACGAASTLKHVIFVCSQNRLRSPTAARVFANHAGIEVASAGLDDGATNRVTPEVLEWADYIFVMEKRHRNRLSSKFGRYLRNKRVICLHIPDEYEYMDRVLVKLLESKVSRYLVSK